MTMWTSLEIFVHEFDDEPNKLGEKQVSWNRYESDCLEMLENELDDEAKNVEERQFQ